MLKLGELRGERRRKAAMIIVRVGEKEKEEIRRLAKDRMLSVTGYLIGLHRLAKKQLAGKGGIEMSYRIYDNQKADRWAMLHRANCREYMNREGSRGWYGPYQTTEKALDDAHGRDLGTVYPCRICSPFGL